jgi:hypothetical protein
MFGSLHKFYWLAQLTSTWARLAVLILIKYFLHFLSAQTIFEILLINCWDSRINYNNCMAFINTSRLIIGPFFKTEIFLGSFKMLYTLGTE